ncbi:hypothetical protein [Micrococcoides hystricis]|uniref:YiaAB two helix domain-containing protein n=1 Tax=Micrococcoides hystricis TaxID=1572761 RepID=A0ABV6PB50_9MICC
MRSNGKVVNYSGQGQLVSNIIMFVVFFGLFLGSVYALSFWDFDNVWIPGLVCLGLLTVVFFVLKTVTGRNASAEDMHKEMAVQPRSMDNHPDL